MLILSELTLYYFDWICAIQTSTKHKRLSDPDSELEGPIADWVDKIASRPQLKPSAPPSARPSKTSHIADVDYDDPPEEFDEQPRKRGAKGIVQLIEKRKDAARGKKRATSVIEEPEDIAFLADTEDEVEILDDPQAAEDEDSQAPEDEDPQAPRDEDTQAVKDEDLYQQRKDVGGITVGEDDMMVDDGENAHMEAETIRVKAESRVTSLMSVDISDKKTVMNARSENSRGKIKKGKPNNADLPSGIYEHWRAKFVPCLMYWVGNSDHPWTITEVELGNVLEDIYNAVRSREQGPADFDIDGRAFYVASQKIHEWRAGFGSAAVTVLMTFLTSMPEYNTQAARKEYAEYQLEDLRFIYEDPDNEEQPGAFLSEFILRIFAAHLAAIAGKVRVDALVEFGEPGYQTALALTAAAAERALTLVRDGLVIENVTSDDKKTYKIMLTLNEATNKMSTTGTAFSCGNWETDTLAYMDSVKALPHSRIQEILTRGEVFMKSTRRKGRDGSGTSGSTAPANKRARLRI
ncbi:hypothetical protein DEU56DRAFT_172235 [Suillus clintonianus]|uniref:uncharacterized protein n=1 Tax=Suillus clintonianus TaxID=1904413 RepID=UPI001B86272F|nr:uncharacterized protein DEU56DRAFT_172235 [Suillus clintonianus]KAG2116275.1 hypothetical protein DEU56DRAFT_172235 [Suillus clintonianus]